MSFDLNEHLYALNRPSTTQEGAVDKVREHLALATKELEYFFGYSSPKAAVVVGHLFAAAETAVRKGVDTKPIFSEIIAYAQDKVERN